MTKVTGRVAHGVGASVVPLLLHRVLDGKVERVLSRAEGPCLFLRVRVDATESDAEVIVASAEGAVYYEVRAEHAHRLAALLHDEISATLRAAERYHAVT